MSKLKSKLRWGIDQVLCWVPEERSILRLSWAYALICLAGLALIPLTTFSKKLSPDENALLLRSSWLYYSDHHDSVAMDHVTKLNRLPPTTTAKVAYLKGAFDKLNIKSASQPFNYRLPLEAEASVGINYYAVLRAPRGDGTEALVLNADWRSLNTSETNHNGVALLLSIAELFAGASYWAKDVILLITDGGLPAYHAWLSAYHSSEPLPGICKLKAPTFKNSNSKATLSLRSGAIQLAVDLDLPGVFPRYSKVEIGYGGVNGVLPNLDLMTSIVRSFELIGEVLVTDIYSDSDPDSGSGSDSDTYLSHFRTASRQLLRQASCAPSTPQGLFLTYDVDAITVRGVVGSDPILGFYQIGQAIECTFRSLNNLLERLHHATRFYLVIAPLRYNPLDFYLGFLIAIGLLPLFVAVLHLRKFDETLLPEKVTSDNSQLDLYVDASQYPTLQFRAGLHGPLVYLICLAIGLFCEKVASQGLYKISNPLYQIGWLALVGVSAILCCQFIYSFFPYHSEAPREAKLLALAVTGTGVSILASINAGLSLLLGFAALPYALFYFPNILPDNLIVFSSPLMWPVLVTSVNYLSNYGFDLVLERALDESHHFIKATFITCHLLGGWLIPAIVLLHLPLHLTFLLPKY